ncbi:MAG: hypothetical protein JNN00_16775 [Chitinophagaceae bacterium]|nr:hypothetical protein [Chitinophagaceae bacterium]
MKKYIIPVIALMLVAGAVNAQATPKKTSTSNPVAKMNKPAMKTASTTAAVSPSAPVKKTNTGAAAIKRKHTKKHKSVKPVSK